MKMPLEELPCLYCLLVSADILILLSSTQAASMNIQENRPRIKFTYSLNILWRHLENTEFADLPYLRLGFYFHWVFTKMASKKRFGWVRIVLSCWSLVWLMGSAEPLWQFLQENRERRLAITCNPSKHKSDFSKIFTVWKHNFHTHYPTKYSLNHYGERTNWLRTSVLRTVTSFCIRRPRQALQHMVRNPPETWVEAGLFIMPTVEDNIKVRRGCECGRGSKHWRKQGWRKILEITCLILHPSSPPLTVSRP